MLKRESKKIRSLDKITDLWLVKVDDTTRRKYMTVGSVT